jgi:hypothetical protein
VQSAAVILTTKQGKLLTLSASTKSFENCRKMSNFLVDEPKYSFLKELGIERRNPGVFNGKWGGSGEVSHHLSSFICFELCLQNISEPLKWL